MLYSSEVILFDFTFEEHDFLVATQPVFRHAFVRSIILSTDVRKLKVKHVGVLAVVIVIDAVFM